MEVEERIKEIEKEIKENQQKLQQAQLAVQQLTQTIISTNGGLIELKKLQKDLNNSKAEKK